ncbi:hypothetical protein WMY93_027752 [Mugilogobius chulae]|uniref:Gypsy retrotransposon integrase-like protein 1 n=1 Tax=Mugilogobius chulae TaxID=88201 RepID=A0AAW0N687_9GOBI
MSAHRGKSDTRPKVKEEVMDSDYSAIRGHGLDYSRTFEHAARIRQTAKKLAADAGFGTERSSEPRVSAMTDAAGPDVNKYGVAQGEQVQVKTPKYSGKADWDAFHAQFELLARAAGWSVKVKALQLALCLTDDALSCLLLLSPAERDDYGALVGALRRRFGQCNQPDVLRSELASRQRLAGEPLRVLANDIETLTRRAYAHMPAGIQSELARDQFIRALTPRELRAQTQLAHPRTLQEALELALERETVGAAAENNSVVRNAVQEGPHQDKPAWVAELTELIRAVSLQSPRSGTRPRRGPPVCWVCGQVGHINGTTQAPAPVSQAGMSQVDGAQRSSRGSGAPLPPEADDATAESSRVVGWTHVGDFCHVPITLKGAQCIALVDTGSTATLMRPDVVPPGTLLEPTVVKLRTVTGELAPMLGRGLVTIQVGEMSVDFRVWVAAVQDPCILGLDFLRAACCVLDLGRNAVTFPGGSSVKMVRPVQVPSPCQAASRATETQEEVPPTLPTTPHPPPASDQPPAPDDKDRVAAVRQIWERNCTTLDAHQQEMLWQVLEEYKNIFALSEEEVGLTHLVHHEIDTGDAHPIKTRPRRLPLAHQAAADKAIDGMLKAGIIEPSDSPWASGVVMVNKKNNPEMRFCVDYRPLNSVTRKDSYPLPRIDESLDLVSGSSWFSSLDLRSGYWQVPLSPDARPKTAFCTGRGLWQFRVLPFGLCNAPATFERLMEKVLADIPRQECLVYLDDILVHGNSFETALESLRQVLHRISVAGLKLHPNKCCFMKKELEFLGHKVGGEGISTLEDKVQAVRDWPTPTNLRELKSFIGLASYYRRFVRGFSCIAAPLFTLQRKDCDFVWTPECDQAFSALKKALTESPILTPPDTNLPFVMDTDASDVGMGAVLSQLRPEGEKVVAYFSKTFNKAERRYCVTRRELLAIVRAIGHFRYYLCGLPFTIRTDHSALQWLMSFKEPEGQIARWLEELAPFNFKVEYRAGGRHANADAMSRRPCDPDNCRYCGKREAREQELCADGPTCRVAQIHDAFEWRAQQEQDPDLQPVLQWVESGQRPQWNEVTGLSLATKGLFEKFGALRVKDGVLQRGWKEPATGEEKWQIVVPKTLRDTVLKTCHGTTGAGHFGVSKTLRRLRNGFYWGQLRRDVEDFCRRCDLCASYKGPPGQSRAELQQLAVGAPMERVAVDIMGPFPRTDKGNRYVLAAMDYFTKWPEAFAIPDQEAETVADTLVDGMFSRFGVAEVIHSDQGRNFESAVFSAMCERMGMQKTRTTPLHPQSDGLVERFNRTLAKQLAIVTAEHQRDWDMHLPLVLLAYRSSVQESTSCTPALLMLGRELRTPAEMFFGRPPDTPAVPPGPEYARRLQDRIETAHTFARDQLQKAGVRQKRNYDLRAKGKDFNAGDLVWVFSPKRKKGRCPKLDCHWVGPCEVLEKLGEVVYRVQLPPRGRRVALHRDRLAPYQGDESPLQRPKANTPQTNKTATPQTLTVSPTQSPQSASPICPPPQVITPKRPQRQRRVPGHLKDFLCDPSGRGT